jgi:tetratricopeptide (TPR) repeat protein
MKILVIAFVSVLGSVALAIAPGQHALAQNGTNGTIALKDPKEFNAYESFTSETDPKAKSQAGESFLTAYPRSAVSTTVLQQLMEAYQQLGDAGHVLTASSRLLELDPNNFEAIYFSVAAKESQCGKTSDPQTCDDAAALARRGLALTKPADLPDADWQRLVHLAFPVFHSTIAADDVVSKKDLKAAEDEYVAELKMYSDDESRTVGLRDTLLLGQAYAQAGTAQNLPIAIWLYARAWDFAPTESKSKIEPALEYYYKKHHGTLDGMDQVKSAASESTFPPAGWSIASDPGAASH